MSYPNVTRTLDYFIQLHPWVSIDFEWRDHVPTIVGLCSGGHARSVFYDNAAKQKLFELEKKGVTWLGHNLINADKPVIEDELNTIIPIERCEDSMIRHYLCNAELCKSGAKDEDEMDQKGMGYLDLWSMSSLYTDLPQWKQCRGEKCEGPCKIHDVLGYNGLDALAPDIALPKMKKEMEAKGIPEKLYDHMKVLTLIGGAMERQGIKVDMAHVAVLEAEAKKNKDKLFGKKIVNVGKKKEILKEVFDAPFNPQSPAQVMEYFGANGIHLRSASKEDIQRALNRLPHKTTAEAKHYLELLNDFKGEGKGLAAWFNEKYIDSNGLIHPRFISTGTSTGRMASSKPNFQNIPRIGFGKLVRAAIVPRNESLVLVKADYSQLELRICLWYSTHGTAVVKGDAFAWLVEQGAGLFENAAEGCDKSARDVAKSVSHGGDYGEGLTVLDGTDLARPYTRKLVSCGALVIHRDWEYAGGVVAFNGINLATRLFGSASYENRKKALEIQEAYFKRFHQIREWQKRVSQQAESGHVQIASGRYLTLLGSREDRLKIALACHGQGSGADYVQEGMLRYYKMGYIPLMQVHDELVLELPRETSNDQIKALFKVMTIPSTFMPGFTCPVKVSKGFDWLNMEELGMIE